MSEPALRCSPLDAAHRAMGARMAPFGGWDMPLEYSGAVSEHLACRSAAAAFDVSHLGTVVLPAGDSTVERVRDTLTNDITKITPGRAQYTHLLDDNASVVDDIIIWWLPSGDMHVMPNASNTAGVRAVLGGDDVTEQRAVIAVQGPDARTLLARRWPSIGEVGRFHVAECNLDGTLCTVAGTGYTGGPGVEIAVPRDAAEQIWAAIGDCGVPPAGLGARDTLRVEAGLPLHGHELGPDITPLQAGLGWVVAFDTDFIGREALLTERERGPRRRLCGLDTGQRRPIRHGYEVVVGGKQVAEVTSGNFIPTLGRSVGMALLPHTVARGDSVDVMARGSAIAAQVVNLPFTSN